MKLYVVKDSATTNFFNPGQKLYEYTGQDWGLKTHHENVTGVKHINVSINGKVPFVTVPRHDLEAVLSPLLGWRMVG